MRLRLSEEFWRLVESETGKARETVLGPGRDAEAVRVRMILGVILVQEYALKPAEAGQLLDKDRATVTGWVRDHDTRMRYYREYREDYDRLSEVIASYCDSEDIFDLGESFYDEE